MMFENLEAIKAVALWSGLNLALMFALAVNVYRNRTSHRVPIGGSDEHPKLQRAIRAHGNNIEYVPSMLLAMLLCALLGESLLNLHIAGATLLIARILHAVGIQQTHTPIPTARVLGNVLCWLLFILLIVRLIWLSTF